MVLPELNYRQNEAGIDEIVFNCMMKKIVALAFLRRNQNFKHRYR